MSIRRTSAKRGGSFGIDNRVALAHAERAGAAPGTEFRFASAGAESSPLRAGTRRAPRVPMLVAALCCIVLAAWFGGSAGYIHAKAWLGQRLLSNAWHASESRGAAIKPWPWADTHPVARLVVPARGVDLLVLAGASGRTLAWGPGHLDGSAIPGTRGTSVITAHRDTHFAFLQSLAPGDRILVHRARGAVREYRVDRMLIADHRSLRLPDDDRSTTLALVTCYPFDAIDPGTPLRYAVIAHAD